MPKPSLMEIALLARKSIEPGMAQSASGPQSAGTCLHASMIFMILLQRFSSGQGTAQIRGGQFGVRSKSGDLHGHYWVEVTWGDSRYVVDITADQFGYAPVVVMPLSESYEVYQPGPQGEVSEALAKLARDFDCADLLVR